MKRYFAIRIENETIEQIKKLARKNKIKPTSQARKILEAFFKSFK